MSGLTNKKIVLGITGGIAAYKTPDLVRKLTEAGASVRVVLTASAKEFVSAMSLQAVSGNIVSDDLLDPAAEAAMGHIELAKWADLMLIAPTTANFMAKLTYGLADDLLSTICLATPAPIAIAPAMNQQMWRAEATQQNLSILQQRDIKVLGPAEGEQACGDIGPGRMVEPEQIIAQLTSYWHTPLLNGRHVVITAGPTRESIDPVRYISNHSSGKMGYALAQAAIELGAKVTLVSGPVALPPPQDATTIKVDSAEQMHQQVMQVVEPESVFIACAAVADYRPAQKVTNKIKKNDEELTLTFVRNPDILADVAALKPAPFTVGFAAETNDVVQYATEKLQKKKLNMIAANDVSAQNIGFNSEQNALTVIWPNGKQFLPQANKSDIAIQLLTLISEQLK